MDQDDYDAIDWDAARDGTLSTTRIPSAIAALQGEVMQRQQTPAPAQAQVGAGPYGLPSLPDLPAPPDTRPSATSYDPATDDQLRTALDSLAKSTGGYLPYDLGQRTIDMFAGTPLGRSYYGGKLAGQGFREMFQLMQDEAQPSDPRVAPTFAKQAAGEDLLFNSVMSAFPTKPAGMLAYRFAQGPATGHLLADSPRLMTRVNRFQDRIAPITDNIDDRAFDRGWNKVQAALPEWLQPIMYAPPRNRWPPLGQ